MKKKGKIKKTNKRKRLFPVAYFPSSSKVTGLPQQAEVAKGFRVG